MGIQQTGGTEDRGVLNITTNISADFITLMLESTVITDLRGQRITVPYTQSTGSLQCSPLTKMLYKSF